MIKRAWESYRLAGGDVVSIGAALLLCGGIWMLSVVTP